MYSYEDFLMLSKRYSPKVKNIQDIYFSPDKQTKINLNLSKSSDTVICHFDKKGTLTKWKNLDTVEVCKYHFENGRVTKIEYYQKEVLMYVNTLKFDDFGRIKEENIQEVIQQPYSKSQYIIYEYDKENVVLKRSYSYGISYDYLVFKRFNQINQVIEERLDDFDGTMQHTKFMYNKEGNCIKNLWIENGVVIHSSKNSYYKNGLLKMSGKDFYDYLFDFQGNLIEKRKFSEFGLCYVLRRVINYY